MKEKEDDDLRSIRQTLDAMLAIQIADRPEGVSRPTEVLLADVGLSLNEIARLTGRKYEAVKTAVRRARAATTSGATNDQ